MMNKKYSEELEEYDLGMAEVMAEVVKEFEKIHRDVDLIINRLRDIERHLGI